MSPRPPAAPALDLAAVAALCAVAAAGWSSVHGGTRWAVAVGGGVLLGTAAGAAGAWRRLPALAVAALTVVGVVVLGPVLAVPDRPVPAPGSLRLLLSGAVEGWRDVLTLVPPVGTAGGLLVPALVATTLAAVLSASAALRSTRTWPALVPPVALLALTGALGTARPTLPVVAGVVLLAVGLAWSAVRRARRAVTTSSATVAGSRRRTAAGAAAVLAVAAVAGTLAPAVAAPERPRWSLREVVQPPLDARAYASPLAGFRRYVKDLDDTPLFTLEGLPQGARVRLATLDDYDGVVWAVAPPGAGAGSGRYLRTTGATGDPAAGTPAQVRVTVEEYRGVWLPTVGQTRALSFGGARADDLAGALHYNAATGTALSTRPVSAGDSWLLDAVVPPQPSDTEVGPAEPAPLTLPTPRNVPAPVAETASELAADAATAVQRARALQAGLAEGFFSHGLASEAPSRAGHGADRLLQLLGGEQMVGDQEQYAAAMALMARALGLPARVVLGFVPEGAGTVTVTGDDVSAWVEVAFAGVGWVAFDPTPDESRTPQQQAPQPRSAPRPQVPQPPPPVQEPEQPPTASSDDADREESAEQGAAGAVLRAAALVGVPLLVVLGPVVLLLALKARRRRRRLSLGTPATRIAGGWAELLDAARDLGHVPPRRATRREAAHALDTAFDGTGAVALAERADAGVFAPGEPSEEEVARFWSEVDRALSGMGSSVGRWRRLRARLSTASLRRG